MSSNNYNEITGLKPPVNMGFSEVIDNYSYPISQIPLS